jgi:hypothetical protein
MREKEALLREKIALEKDMHDRIKSAQDSKHNILTEIEQKHINSFNNISIDRDRLRKELE